MKKEIDWDFDLRKNAEIVHIAMQVAKSLDSTPLKEWFKREIEQQLSEKRCNNRGVKEGWEHCTVCTRDSCSDWY